MQHVPELGEGKGKGVVLNIFFEPGSCQWVVTCHQSIEILIIIITIIKNKMVSILETGQ